MCCFRSFRDVLILSRTRYGQEPDSSVKIVPMWCNVEQCRAEMNTTDPAAELQRLYPPILTTALVAEMMHCTICDVRDKVHRKELPAMRWGQQVRCFRDEVIATMIPVDSEESPVEDEERPEETLGDEASRARSNTTAGIPKCRLCWTPISLLNSSTQTSRSSVPGSGKASCCASQTGGSQVQFSAPRDLRLAHQ